MHLAFRAYVLIFTTALVAIAGIWSSLIDLSWLWHIPAALGLLGLGGEAVSVRRLAVVADVAIAPRAFLGRPQRVRFLFTNRSSRPTVIKYAPLLPIGFEPLARPRRVTAPALSTASDEVTLLPVRLGRQTWPAMPARLLGPYGLVWWSRELQPQVQVAVAPDISPLSRIRPRGNPAGARQRRAVGAGSELHQLRDYARGDPLARIDWKATARTGNLVTREFSEDQHLDIVVAIDAGRYSRVRAGRLDRLGLYANLAARFAQVATPHDDRIGLYVFSDRPLAVCAPDRGPPAILRIRRALEQLGADVAESDLGDAAVGVRRLLKHRSLVVLLTDLEDAAGAEQLLRAVRLLSPPHVVVIAGIASQEINSLTNKEATEWSDPWVAMAAREHEVRAETRSALLRKRGAYVIRTPADLLTPSVIGAYEALRRVRRI